MRRRQGLAVSVRLRAPGLIRALAVTFFTAALPWCAAAEAELASALDNYRVQWRSYVLTDVTVPDHQRIGWERVPGGNDGVDSLRTVEDGEGKSLIGRNESAVLETTVIGPARVAFHWKAEPDQGDLLVFRFSEKNGSAQPTLRRYESTGGGWERVEENLNGEDVVYRLSWSYERDNSDPSGGAAWLDDITISGKHYGRIVPEADHPQGDGTPRYVILQWPTIPGRVYQLRYYDADGVAQDATERMEARDNHMKVPERKYLYEQRKDNYEVVLLEPPAIVKAPPERTMEVVEGDSLSLAYEASGTGDILWVWTFDGVLISEDWPDSESVVEVDTSSDGRKMELRIKTVTESHDGTWRVTVRDGESAPSVKVHVFQPPVVGNMRFILGSDPKGETSAAPGPGPFPVELGEKFCITTAHEVAGSGQVRVQWQKRDATLGALWEDLPGETEGRLCRNAASGGDEGAYRLAARNEWVQSPVFGPEVAVRVLHPARVTHLFCTEPVNLYQGDVVALTAEPTGTPPFKYQWFKEGQKTDDGVTLDLPTERAYSGYDEYIVRVEGNGKTVTQASPVHVGVRKLEPRKLSDLDIVMLPVRGGRFNMGSNEESAAGNEGPMRKVVLTRSFWMSRTEISNRQWLKVMGGESGGRPDNKLPVSVSHDEAVKFVDALNRRERMGGRLPTGWTYALPTEAQWERAARIARPPPVGQERGSRLQPVDSGTADGEEFLGLLGNAWEWTTDWYRKRYDPKDITNPGGPPEGVLRVLRGGGVDIKPLAITPTIRHRAVPNRSRTVFGMRIVLDRPFVAERYVVHELVCPGEPAGEAR